jgi:hypothetical protein
MTNAFADLRAKYFELPRPNTPAALAAPEPWGIVMEIAYPQAILTTVAFADGTASVLRSTGGGFFGGGDAGVQQAREEFLKHAQLAQAQMTQVQNFPEPNVGYVVFYARTDHGVYAASASVAELQPQGHPLRQLYFAGLGVLNEYLRLQKQTQQ